MCVLNRDHRPDRDIFRPCTAGLLCIVMALAMLIGSFSLAGANDNQDDAGRAGPIPDTWYVWNKKEQAGPAPDARPRRAKARRSLQKRGLNKSALRRQVSRKRLRAPNQLRRTVRRAASESNLAATSLPPQMPRQVIVAFASTMSDQIIDQVAAEFALQRLSDTVLVLLDQRVVLFATRADFSDQDVLLLAADARAISAQRNFIYELSADISVQYAVDRLHLSSAQRRAQGSGVRVAVIDSGVDIDHPSLAGAVSATFDATDGKGRRDARHGTAVASVIAARNGIVGTAPGADLLAVTAFVKLGEAGNAQGTSYNLLRSIDWAVGANARLLNLSFAGPRDPLLHELLIASTKRGVIGIASVGNAGRDAPPAFPAAYPEIIAATATDPDNRLYRRAVIGGHVSVAAPGVDILVAAGKGGYGLSSGTSLAAGYVTGVAALLLQLKPGIGRGELEARLGATALDLGAAGRDPEFGYGLIDAAKALQPE